MRVSDVGIVVEKDTGITYAHYSEPLPFLPLNPEIEFRLSRGRGQASHPAH
jgi:hypothetical protein